MSEIWLYLFAIYGGVHFFISLILMFLNGIIKALEITIKKLEGGNKHGKTK